MRTPTKRWFPPWGAVVTLALVHAGLVSTSTAMAPAPNRPTPKTPHPTLAANALDATGAGRAKHELDAASGGAWDVVWGAGVAAWGRGGPRPGAARVPQAAIQAAADAFRSRHAALLGAADATLVPVRTLYSGRAWHVTWKQEVGGLRVVGSFLDLTLAADGTVVGFHSTLAPGLDVVPLAVDADAARHALEREIGRDLVLEGAEPVIFVGETAVAAVEIHAGLASGARWRAVVDAEGRILENECLVREAALAGLARTTVQWQYIQDEPTDVTLPWLEIRVGFAENGPKAHTDVAGAFNFDLDPGDVVVRCGLRGLYCWVDNEDPFSATPSLQRTVTAPGNVVVRLGAAEARPDERTIYFHVNRMHDFFKSHYEFTLVDFPVPALAAAVDPFTGDPNYPNAYWNGTQLGFGQGGATFWNLGLFADVIYHEYAHVGTDLIYEPVGGLRGGQAPAMHEGLADYFACTMTGEPELGEFLQRRTPAPLRTLDNRLIWPEHRDKRDEPHANGVIFAGALWDVRGATGSEVTDALVHFARLLLPTSFEEFRDCMLIQDDLLYDDGWIGNGSPHRDAILTAFAAHGMGPLARHSLAIAHQPLRDTEDDAAARRVSVRLSSFVRDDEGVVRLSYRNGAVPFTHVVLQRDATGNYSGEIPAMPAGALVEYYLSAARLNPIFVSFLPSGAPETLFQYHVGPDVEPPHVEHAPRTTAPAFTWPPELVVQVDDNQGLAYAYAEIWRSGTPLGTVGFAPVPGEPNVYVARLPNTGGEVGEHFQYAITAVDLARAGNTTRVPALGTLDFVVVENLQEDFEHGAGAWRHQATVVATPDPWQMSTAFNHTPGGQQAWLCGAADGGYPAMAAGELVTDWFRIDSGAQAAIWSWMDAALATDGKAMAGGRIEIQRDGEETWTLLTPEGGYTNTLSTSADGGFLEPTSPCLSGTDAGWQELRFDLSAWTSRRARLRFLFGSAATAPTAAHRGWLLDDFSVFAGTPNPTDTGVLPSRLALRVGPNPFNPQLSFYLDVPPRAGALRLEIVDARGRVLRRILNAPLAAGPHHLVWDGHEADGLAAAAGVYYYRLVWHQGLETGKVVLVR